MPSKIIGLTTLSILDSYNPPYFSYHAQSNFIIKQSVFTLLLGSQIQYGQNLTTNSLNTPNKPRLPSLSHLSKFNLILPDTLSNQKAQNLGIIDTSLTHTTHVTANPYIKISSTESKFNIYRNLTTSYYLPCQLALQSKPLLLLA